MSAGQPTLGKLLRAMRSHNGWTLREMSDRSGIPVSTLSKVEHDRLTLTYDKLQQLSQRLGIRMSELFAETSEETEVAVTARRSIGRLDRAIQVTTPNYDYHFLCPELRRKRMIPLITNIRAKTVEQFGELVRHSGEEYIYVLDGRIEIHTEFYDPVVLEKDESIYIDSQMGHAYVVADGCEQATVLGICSSADEDLMSSLLNLHGSEPGEAEKPRPAAVRDLRHPAPAQAAPEDPPRRRRAGA
jgi:transcriptional regulator with XRE-family HTH domain